MKAVNTVTLLSVALLFIGCKCRKAESGTVLMGGLVCESEISDQDTCLISNASWEAIEIVDPSDWEDYDLGVVLKVTPSKEEDKVMKIR